MGAVIEVRGLRKEFKVARRKEGPFAALRTLFSREFDTRVAVDDVSFTIERGELVGYIGPNGAGKSTTIKMLTGILVPTAGEVRVRGVVPYLRRVENARQIGAVFGQRTQLWWDLPTVESFELLRHIYKVPRERYRQNMDLFRDLLGLDEFLNTPVRQLSLGQRMRADLAAALLHDPEIVYLDEPTIGLDVVAKERIRDFIRTINRERGVTVILTTHDMQDIEKICERMILIDHGRVIYDGPVAQIKERFGKHRTLVVDLEPNGPVVDVAVEGAELVRRDGHRIWLRFNRDELSASELIARVSARCAIRDLTVEEPEIEGIIARIYQEGI
ncbi:ABC transporter ATP-binding protein [Symbiobacterium thermophilum]|uniref:ABC transporter ATP-binding protein n=1 Tax=Symbiobacterium thermophilum (strain DSM 24528 / JCM 14929 / IAM 14863 / T) TaxID=292459 RepID=Q67KZ7_SYMTH|nr:ATP-binding cassette domain-containing protein [Symbiobacterium thermophilum]BAD41649.1 ABC transporter ATP-binding protein [Symbiobacterium thermophilum IAM 14863]